MTERIVDPALVEAGIDHLCKVDPIMAGTIAAVGPCKLTLEDNLFYALVDAITSQQISVKAAASILKRICALYAPDPFPTPERLAATPVWRHDQFRDPRRTNHSAQC